jgi:hypothetical protein
MNGPPMQNLLFFCSQDWQRRVLIATREKSDERSDVLAVAWKVGIAGARNRRYLQLWSSAALPTGWKPYDRQRYAVKGHSYGLSLSETDRRALIAFLKTL